MIALGSVDAGVPQSACDAYLHEVEQTTRIRLAEIADGRDKVALVPVVPDAQQPMTVADVQRGLRQIGFFPGGIVDGICGYRTLSAMRLFQEYVRSSEHIESTPDGRFGAMSQGHLRRWLDRRLRPEWTATVDQWAAGSLGDGEYAQWLALLANVKATYLAAPRRMLTLVNGYTKPTDTRKVSEWDTDSRQIHLIGIRRDELSGKFDDIFVLLLKGLVFKFQGSTEPGASSSPLGLPFLVQGQHDYHFGWHKRQYLALRPLHLDHGVLVVRSRNDKRLDDRDLDNGLEANASINIHWGGRGLTREVKDWSEGCQVINGSVYMNQKNQLVDCSAFAASNNSEVSSTPSKTRGAYNVLLDLVTALASNMGTNTVKYMLLAEADMDLDHQLKEKLADARALGQIPWLNPA